MRGIARYLAVLIVSLPAFAFAQAVDTQSQISALLALLNQLQAQIETAAQGQGQGSAAVTAPTVDDSWNTCLDYAMNLKQGYFDTSGNPGPIKSLQLYLIHTGDFTHEATGYYGALTEAAVQSWQRRRGLVSSGTPDTTGYGILGPKTRAALKAATCTAKPSTGTGQPGSSVAQPVTQPIQTPVRTPSACLLNGSYIPSGTSLLMYSRASVSPTDSCARYAISRSCFDGVVTGDPAYTYSSCQQSAAGSCVIGGITLADGESRTFYTPGPVYTGDSCANHAMVRTCVQGVLSGDVNYMVGGCSVAAPRSCTLDGVTVTSGTSRTFYSQRTIPATASCSTYGFARPCTDGTFGGSSTYQYASCTNAATSTCTIGSVTLRDGESKTFYSQSSLTTGSCASYAQTRTCNGGLISGGDTYQYASCLDTVTSCAFDGLTLPNGATTTAYLVQNVASTDSCSFYSTTRQCSSAVLSGDSSYKYRSCAPAAASSCVLDNLVLASGASAYFYSAGTAPAGSKCTSIRQSRKCTNGVLAGTATYNRASCTDATSCSLDGVTLADGASGPFYSASSVAYGTTCASVMQTRTCTNGALSGSATYAYGSCKVSAPVTAAPFSSQLAALAESLTAILASLGGR